MKAEDIKGLPVVSIAEGTRIGTVDDLQFSTADRRIEMLSLTGPVDRQRLAFSDIQSVGSDAITVRTQDLVKPIGDTKDPVVGALLTLSDLMARKVVDNHGTALGSIDTVEIDPISGVITEIKVGHGGIAGLGRSSVVIVAADIVSIGDVIMVRGAGSS